MVIGVLRQGAGAGNTRLLLAHLVQQQTAQADCLSIGIRQYPGIVNPDIALWGMARPEVLKTELGQRLRLVRQKAGDLSRDEFAQHLGLSSKTLANYERGDTQPDAQALAAYRRFAEVDANWLITGDGEMFGRSKPQRAQIAASRALPDVRGQRIYYEQDEFGNEVEVASPARKRADKRREDEEAVQALTQLAFDLAFVRLPFYHDVLASAGPGALAPSEETDSIIAFTSRFLRDLGATPERCSVIRAKGDSMAPTIPDGALLVVDHSQAEVSNGCLAVINVGDDLMVKRVRRRLDGLIDLISDNGAYPPETIGADRIEQLRIIGRVVYFCRTP